MSICEIYNFNPLMPSVSYLKKSFCVIIFLKKNINKLHNKLFSFFS